MMIIKLFAVLFLAGSVGVSAGNNQATPGIKQAAPATYDIRVSWTYNAAAGYYQLWQYSTGGGGIWQQVYFAQETTYWRSFVENSFYAGTLTWQLRIPRSVSNDALFTQLAAGKYYYTSPDNIHIAYYSVLTPYFRMYVSVLESDYRIDYMRDMSEFVNGIVFMSQANEVFYTNTTVSFMRNTVANTYYNAFATFSSPSNVLYDPGKSAGNLVTDTVAFYFKLNTVSNIEGDDWWDIYNQGVNAGYDAGLDAGYGDGLDAGRLENTAWEDAFTIIKGAIDTVGNVMAIQLFGPISIGTLVSIPLIVGLLFWIIDKWRGS